MARVPRIHDGVELVRDGEIWRVKDPSGRDCGWLDQAGRFLVLRFDGLRQREALLKDYADAFCIHLSDADLEAVVKRMDAYGLLNTNPRALWALRYLADREVQYRTKERDRRVRDGRDEEPPRRTEDDIRARAWDHGVFLLNEGYLEQARTIFGGLRGEQVGDVRLEALLGHLDFLVAKEDQPDLYADRRDEDWEAFDRALRTMLDAGVCPRCSEALVVELGRTNHCTFCGNSFTSYVLQKASSERRS